MALLLFFVTALIFWGSRSAKKGEEFSSPLGKEDATMLKGAFALLVFCHHIYQHLSLWQPFRLLADVGFLWVGGFFFLSGYGLMKSLDEKDHYFKGYFRKRMSAILVPFFLVNAVEIILRLRVKERILPEDVAGSFVLDPMLDGNHWFLVAIFLFYLVFYVSYRFLPRWTGHLLCFAFVTAYLFLFSDLTRGETWWYNAVYAFPVGILWARRKKEGGFWLPWSLTLLGFLFFFGTEYFMGLDRGKTFQWFLQNANSIASTKNIEHIIFICQSLSAVFLALFIAISLKKWKPGNRLLGFFGKISYEFYLIHGCVIFVLKSRAVDIRWDSLFALLALLLSTLLATGIHALAEVFLNFFKKEKKYVPSK